MALPAYPKIEIVWSICFPANPDVFMAFKFRDARVNYGNLSSTLFALAMVTIEHTVNAAPQATSVSLGKLESINSFIPFGVKLFIFLSIMIDL